MTTKLYFNEMSYQPLMAQLQQLTCLTWDGDLIGKTERDKLIYLGYAKKVPKGWNIITDSGIKYLENLGFIHS